MKYVVRRLPVVLVFLLALTLAAPALAQGGDPLCTGLSESDCQLLLGPTTAMAGITSFTTPVWAIDVNMSDGTEEFAFNANGSGGFQFAPDASEFLVHLVIEQAAIAGVRGGTIDMAGIIGATFGNVVPEYSVLGVLYVFRDADHMRKAMNGPVGTEMAAALQKKGIATDAQRDKLLDVAGKCPVHKLMTQVTTEIETGWL